MVTESILRGFNIPLRSAIDQMTGADGMDIIEEPTSGHGRMKLFLGYAPGVGKTYTMLAEAHRRRTQHKQDVVVGVVDARGRPDTEDQIGDIEVLKRRSIEFRGYYFDELDTQRVIERRPQWVVIDDLAHTNVPGSRNTRRYQDVAEIRDHGINVLTAMNVSHIDSLSDAVCSITGIHVRDTVPDRVLAEADEVVAVDVSPRALMNRLTRGDVFELDKAPLARASLFTEGNLSALRELALREVAGAADQAAQHYRHEHGVSEAWNTTERVLVCISPTKPADRLLRRGWRIASVLRAELVAVLVTRLGTPTNENRTLNENLKLARELNIRVDQIQGRDISHALSQYAIKNQVTEIVIGHSRTSRFQQLARGSIVSDLIATVGGIDVMVVATPDMS